MFPSVDKSRNSALETLKRVVNAVRDFLFVSEIQNVLIIAKHAILCVF